MTETSVFLSTASPRLASPRHPRTMAYVSFPGYLAVMLMFLAGYIAYTMRTYASANPRLFVWHAYPTIFLAYFCSLSIVLVIPLDVSLTVISRRSIDNEADFEDKSGILVTMYVTFFLITQFGYNGLTFQERYNKSGYFTVKSKVVDCIRYFAVMGIAGLVAGVIFFTILVSTNVVELSFDAVILTIVLLSNTGGLAVLMILLGYGLVSFPQMLWMKGNLQRQLSQAQQQAASRYKALSEISLNMSMLCSTILKTEGELNANPSDDPAITAAIQLIVKERPAEFKSTTAGPIASDKDGKITIDSLAKLRSSLYYLSSSYEMAQGKVEEAKLKAYYYEDLLDSMSRNDGVKRIKWSFGPESTERGYNFHVYVRPMLFRIAAILCMCMSIFSFLGVLGTMDGVGKSISVYATAIHDDNSSSIGICLFVMFTLLYPAYVTMWSIFQMKIARVMELLPGRRTTAPSLSVNSRAVIRLSTPLVFFYLGWVFENGVKEGEWLDGTAGGTVGDDDRGMNRIMMSFAQFYQVQVIPVMGGSFNTLFPIIMFTVSGLVLLNLFNRTLVFLKLEKFQFGAEILSEEQLREGQRQLSRHKRTMERAYQRKALRQHIDGKPTSTAPLKGLSNFFGFTVDEVPQKDLTEKCGDDESDIEKGSFDHGNVEPPVLQGWAEKKGQKKFGVSGGWQPRYFNVVKPGVLVYYKDAAMDGEPNGEVNLGLVMSFTVTTKDDGDKDDDSKVKLELDLADKTFKVRFSDMDEAVKWRTGLIVWKDYCIANNQTNDSDDKSSDDGVQLCSVYAAEETSSNDDETSALTKNMSSSSAPMSFGNMNPRQGSDTFPLEISDKPSMLEGWLEKKQQSKFGKMAQWQKRYFRVDEDSGNLFYFKSTDPHETASGTIDLRVVADVSSPEKDGKVDAVRFNIDLGDKIIKIRAPSTTEGERWIVLLNLWRDYIILK